MRVAVVTPPDPVITFEEAAEHLKLGGNQAERPLIEGMIAAAAQALASMVNAYRPGAPLLPAISDLRQVSATIAVAVAEQAAREGVAQEPLSDPIQQIYARMWQPVYPEIEAI